MARTPFARFSVVLVGLSALLGGCSLLVDTDGFSGGDGDGGVGATSSSGASSGASSSGASSSGASSSSGSSSSGGSSTSSSSGGSSTSSSSGGPGTPSAVQSAAILGSSVSSLSVAFSKGNTAGNLIVVFVRSAGNNTNASVSDSAGNTYATAVSQTQPVSGGSHASTIFYAANIRAGANTVQLSYSGGANNYPFLAIYEYAGLSTTSPLDKTASAIGTSDTPSSGPTATTTAPNELVFAGLGLPHDSLVTVSAGSGFTLGQQETTTARSASEDRLVSATGAYAGSFGLSASDSWSAVVATFK